MARDAATATVADEDVIVDGLSEQEREALQETEDEKSTEADLKAILEDDEKTEPEKATEPEAEAQAEGETETEAESEAEDEPAPQGRFRPEMEVRPVADYDKRIAALDAKKAEIRQKRRDGELEFDQAEEELEKLASERDDLVLQQRDAVNAQRFNEASARQEWAFEVRAFLRGHKEYEDEVLWDALDSTVKRLANAPVVDDEGEPVLTDGRQSFANAERDAQWFLEEAHRLVSARFAAKARAEPEKEAPKPEAKEAKSEDAVREAVGKRRQATGSRPQTLAAVPAAAETETGKNRFAHLDKLSGMDLENAIARLPKADQDAYLRGE